MQDVKYLIGKTTKVFSSHATVTTSTQLALDALIRMFYASVKSVLLYGCKTSKTTVDYHKTWYLLTQTETSSSKPAVSSAAKAVNISDTIHTLVVSCPPSKSASVVEPVTLFLEEKVIVTLKQETNVHLQRLRKNLNAGQFQQFITATLSFTPSQN